MPPLTLHIQKVRIAQIDFEDTSFSLVPLQPEIPSQLKNSISRIGVLHPPIVKEKYADVFQVVCGRRRLSASVEVHNRETCDCFVLPMEVSDPEALMVHLEEIMIRRPVSPIEKATFLKKICCLLGEKGVTDNMLSAIGITNHPHYKKRLFSLLELEEPIIRSIHQGQLDEKVATELTQLPFSDRMSLFEIIDRLSLSVGKQRKLTTGCRELASRQKTSIMDLLNHPEIESILSHPGENSPQKGSNLMSWIDRNCHPQSTAAEKEFDRFSSSLNLPQGTKITHVQAFEKDSMTLSITFKNREELQEKWQLLKPALT